MISEPPGCLGANSVTSHIVLLIEIQASVGVQCFDSSWVDIFDILFWKIQSRYEENLEIRSEERLRVLIGS